MGDHDSAQMSMDELVALTQNFIRLADELYTAGKLTAEEYNELTYVKRDFLAKIEIEKEEEFKRCF